MWKDLVEAFKSVILLSHQTEENRERIKTVQDQIEKLTIAVMELSNEVKRLRQDMEHSEEREADRREKLLLRLENEMLKFERRLPSAPPESLPKGKPRK